METRGKSYVVQVPPTSLLRFGTGPLLRPNKLAAGLTKTMIRQNRPRFDTPIIPDMQLGERERKAIIQTLSMHGHIPMYQSLTYATTRLPSKGTCYCCGGPRPGKLALNGRGKDRLRIKLKCLITRQLKPRPLPG